MSTCLVEREFALHDRRQAQRLRDRDTQRRIEALFGVQLSFPPLPLYIDRAQGQPEGEWITVRGNSNDDCVKAQNYISALCTPECSGELVGLQLGQLLFQEKPRLRDALEREFATALQQTQEGVRVQGLSDAVALTFTKLHSLADTYTMSVSNSGHNYRQGNTSSSAKSLEELDQQLRNLSPSAMGHLPDSVKQALLLLQKRPDLVGTNTPDRLSSPGRQHLPPQQKRIEYFVKLGYPQPEVETVLESLGSDATDNDILARLISTKPTLPVVHVPVSLPPRPAVTEEGPTAQTNREGLRPVVIDGSNVAMRHGNGSVFSCKGILIAVNWFRQRGHSEITVFVPAWRKEPSRPETPIIDQDILLQLEKENLLKFTPSRRIGGRKIVCYDDRFIVQLAHERGGVIVSTDNFRDLMEEDSSWKETIEKRLIMFTFVDDTFMVPKDPLGKHGPHLDDLLRFEGGRGPVSESHHDLSVPRDKVPCPYKERCTFGPKCRYYHPEREKRVREEQAQPGPERVLHSPNPSMADSRSKDIPGYLDGGENVSYQDESSDLELVAAMSHLSFHSSPSKALFPNSTQPILYRRSSTDPHFDRPGGLGVHYTSTQLQPPHHRPQLHSPLNISAPVLMQEPSRPTTMEGHPYPHTYPTTQHSESQQSSRLAEECHPPSRTLARGESGSADVHPEQQHMVGHDRVYKPAPPAAIYYQQHPYPRPHQPPYHGQRSSSWHELAPSSRAHPAPSVSPVGHYHSSVELTPPNVLPHLHQTVSGMDGASHLLYSSQKSAVPPASYNARAYHGVGYYHNEQNLDMRQSFMHDSHREHIFQKAVELYPDRRERIRAILLQHPGLSDMDSLLRLL